MSLSPALPLLRHASILVAAVAFAASSANAQFANSSNPSNTESSSTSESSSTAGPLLADASDGSAALPAAPAPDGAAAGQNGGYGEHGGSGYHDRSLVSHLVFEAGGGANGPVGSSSQVTWGGNFTVGAGYKFNPWLSALVEYQFMDDKLPGALIAEAGATGGNDHIWSFTVDPKLDLLPKSHNNVYVTGGGGFYRKVTNFTDPEPSEYCSYFYCGVAYTNQVVGHYSSNQGGFNIGGGFEHRFSSMYSDDSRVKVFAEVRYVDVLSPAVTTSANGLGTTTVGADTKLLPITLGVRF